MSEKNTDFGKCIICNNEINIKRLFIMPYVKKCINCAKIIDEKNFYRINNWNFLNVGYFGWEFQEYIYYFLNLANNVITKK